MLIKAKLRIAQSNRNFRKTTGLNSFSTLLRISVQYRAFTPSYKCFWCIKIENSKKKTNGYRYFFFGGGEVKEKNIFYTILSSFRWWTCFPEYVIRVGIKGRVKPLKFENMNILSSVLFFLILKWIYSTNLRLKKNSNKKQILEHFDILRWQLLISKW